MRSNTKIILNVPHAKQGKYFALKLKQQLANERSEYEMPDKILALSDIEGNFMAFLHLLIANNVIDRYLRWTFGDGHLVIAGDCFDRGEQVVECLWLIYSLEEKARRSGGYVHFILGNHEIMNLNGDWRYVHPKYAKSSKIPSTALYYGNDPLWHWLCTKNIVEKIGNILFVHGGISEDLMKLNMSVSEINNLARPYYAKANQVFKDPFLRIIFNSENSPFWYRGFYQSDINESHIDDVLSHYRVNTIVTGHTIVNEITTFVNGKLINLDTDHAVGLSEALLIKKGVYYRVNSKGLKDRIK